MSDSPAFTATVSNGIARVALRRTERRNALDVAGMRELGAAIESLTERADVRCLVLSGEGGSFCAGADLPAGELPSADGNQEMMDAVEFTISAILGALVPVIAKVEGAAAGVGASLVFACDLVYASPSAFFLLPFAGIGLIPDGGATRTIAASIGRTRAMRLALLQERLPANEALAAGLITSLVDEDELADVVDSTAERMASGAVRALGRIKSVINDHTLGDMTEVMRRETSEQMPLLASWEYREGVNAFRERRPANFADAGLGRA